MFVFSKIIKLLEYLQTCSFRIIIQFSDFSHCSFRIQCKSAKIEVHNGLVLLLQHYYRFCESDLKGTTWVHYGVWRKWRDLRRCIMCLQYMTGLRSAKIRILTFRQKSTISDQSVISIRYWTHLWHLTWYFQRKCLFVMQLRQLKIL